MNLSEFHRKLSKTDETHYLIKIPLLVASSWLFQGLLYMDNTERNFKIFLDIIIFLPLLLLFNHYLNIYINIVVSIFISHTINWIFNGQIFVLLKNLNLSNVSFESFINYLDEVEKKIENENSIIAAAAFGSLSKQKLKNTSDLDIRIIRKPGNINGIKSCIFVLKERTLSFFNRFPLDIYVLDSKDMIDKHIKNEKPIVIYDPFELFEKN